MLPPALRLFQPQPTTLTLKQAAPPPCLLCFKTPRPLWAYPQWQPNIRDDFLNVLTMQALPHFLPAVGALLLQMIRGVAFLAWRTPHVVPPIFMIEIETCRAGESASRPANILRGPILSPSGKV